MENPAKPSRPSPASRKRRWLRILWLCLGLGVAGPLLVALLLDRFGQVERAQSAPAIVVLGARVLADGTPGDSLRARVRKAAALYRQGLAGKMILTGGQGDHGRPESVVAADLAVSLGIPAGDILRETRSRTAPARTCATQPRFAGRTAGGR